MTRWRTDRPLAAFLCADPRHPFSVLAEPVEHVSSDSPDALERLGEHTRPDPDAPLLPGWIGRLSYDLGRVLEPGAGARTDRHPAPLIELFRVESGLVRTDHRWRSLGGPPLDDAQSERPFALARLRPDQSRDEYTGRVRTALEHIRAGDIYQVNLAHRSRAPFTGSARALFASLVSRADPWYACYLESTAADQRDALISLSPELFLSYEQNTRRVTTRPMKGTRPGRSDPRELRDAVKDKAELDMITDLMRNDLGRVCDFGSVRVDHARTIEHHAEGANGGVLQATSTVSATLRDGLSLPDLICATFPPGSVTGAPKIRAMQIIDRLEPTPRGPYCGTCFLVSDSGRAFFNVAIRTATIRGTPAPNTLDAFADAALEYHAGAGIVADSDPDTEWEETLVKTGVMAHPNDTRAPKTPHLKSQL